MHALLALVPLLAPPSGVLAQETLLVAAEQHQDHVVITAGGEPFTTLWHGPDLQKPYLYPVLGPGGVPLTRGWPMEERPNEAHDHPHHTSLWLAHGDVNGHDFWTGREGARIRLRRLALDLPDETGGLRVTATLDWLEPKGTVLCTESRSLVFRATRQRRTIDVNTILLPYSAELRFGDTKEGTFAMRLRPELRLTGSVAVGHAIDSEGDRDADVWGKRARWVAYWAPVEGDPYTVAVLDHPHNPSHPTWWHARDYGLFAANPFGAHDFAGLPEGTGDRIVNRGYALTLYYRAIFARGPADAATLDREWCDWVWGPVFTGEPLRVAGDLGRITGLACASDGGLVLADAEGGRILALDEARTVSVLRTGLDDPRGVAFDGEGGLVVAERGRGRLVRIAPDGSMMTLVDTAEVEQVGRPYAVVADRRGEIYACTEAETPESASRIVRVDARGTCRLEWTDGANRRRPTAVGAALRAPELWVAFESERLVSLFEPDSSRLSARRILHTDGSPRAVAVDARGRVYVATENGVETFTAGRRHATIPLPGATACAVANRHPHRLWIAAGDALWVVELADPPR